MRFQRCLLGLPAESPEAAAHAVFASGGVTNDLVMGIVVPSLMDPPHPMRWEFAVDHRLRVMQKVKSDGAKQVSIIIESQKSVVQRVLHRNYTRALT
jgi:hypothetical protein